MNIWLIHTYFCYYFYPMVVLVYMPRYAILILPWLLIICLATSKAMTFMYSMLGQLNERISNLGLHARNQE